MSTLDVEGLRVTYAGDGGPVIALSDFSMHVEEGQLTVLLGESGCGKSTALNAIAGLGVPDQGRISLGGAVVFQGGPGMRAINVPPNRRDIGMVFQSYALWPHLTVLENVAYPLRRRHAADVVARATDALAMVRCEQLAQRYPGELSGGQQQRVALARALVGRPRLLLFDESLSNLDAGLRRSLRDELAKLHRDIGFTGIYVTHDQSEALALGTGIAVMDAGRILQSGTPVDVYERPANAFVARFFGANVLSGQVISRSGAGARVETQAGPLDCNHADIDGDVAISFMPQSVSFERDADGPLEVAAAMYVGSHREVRLIGKGCELLSMHAAAGTVPPIGSRVRVRVPPDRIHVFKTG